MDETKKRLQQLLDRYEQKAENGYRKYQETGHPRYCREYENNEDLAMGLRMAVNAADEHTAYYAMRGQVSNLAAKASEIQLLPEEERPKAALKVTDELAAYGRLLGLIGRI